MAGADPALSELRELASDWQERGRAPGFRRWLDRELDADGVPRHLPVTDWLACLALLAAAVQGRPKGWPAPFDARVEGLVRAYLRFARPAGSSVFGPDESGGEAEVLLRFWIGRLADAALARVISDWFRNSRSRAGRTAASPPLPADARTDRPLAVLRANWHRHGDLLAIDHRAREIPCQLELAGLGQTWLGPHWKCEPDEQVLAAPRPSLWQTDSKADVAEWRFRTASARILRTAILLRGPNLALLADLVDADAAARGLRIALPSSVRTAPVRGSRAIKLSVPRGPSARVLPLGLPCLPYPTDRGAFQAESGSLVLRQRGDGARVWMPLLVTWAPERTRHSVRWRLLTVTETWRICPPDVAFACRVAWGTVESLVVYRSLGPPRRRAFLGHQTTARLLIGRFTKDGNLEPIVTIEE